MYKEIQLSKRSYLTVGYSPTRFALGFSVDKYSISIDFLFFWISIEF
jgi:hypothetical protein